jgi:uncharacterized protein (DUF697 family)
MSQVDANASKESETKKKAEKTVRRHMYGAFCAGMIPIPIVDIATLTAVQLDLVRKLTAVYEVPFSKNTVRNIVSSLLAGALPTVIGPYLASMLKAIPFFGFGLGLATVPVVSVAATYAVGQIFIRHFESGGTLLTFDTEKAKDIFGELVKQGMKQASEMKKGVGKSSLEDDSVPVSIIEEGAEEENSTVDGEKGPSKKKRRSPN